MISRAVPPLAAAALFALVAWALLGSDLGSGQGIDPGSGTAPPRLTESALAALPRSGVENPVTAAVLNYRGYDTLLELGVLLLAVVGVWALRRAEGPERAYRRRPLLVALLHTLVPSLVVAAGYLLWVGAFAPGGAFQGGALLAGAIVLGWASGLIQGAGRWALAVRLGLGLGPTVFALAAALALALTGSILGYPEGAAGTWMLAIESAALVSIGLTLAALYVGGRVEAEVRIGVETAPEPDPDRPAHRAESARQEGDTPEARDEGGALHG